MWFENRLNEVSIEVEKMYKQFRLSEALKTIYSLIWDDFCSWYLEWVKPGFEQPINANIYNKTIEFFESLLQMLHPFMPFITEEIYHLTSSSENDLIIKQFDKKVEQGNKKILEQGKFLQEIITAIRDTKNRNGVKPKEQIKIYIQTNEKEFYLDLESILSKQINASVIEYTSDSMQGLLTVVVKKDKIFIQTEKALDTNNQEEQMLKDLDYLKGFLNSVERKLNNEKFVQNAKAEVIELERKKKADAETKIRVIEESLSSLKQ
jgi:valyl-tRNA synthetase